MPISVLLPKLPASLESLYQSVKLLVAVHAKGPEIYDRLRLDLERSAAGLLRVWREDGGMKEEGKEWAERVVKGWEWWSARVVSCPW